MVSDSSVELTTENKIAACPERLQEIIGDFREATPRERLDYLLEYAMDLPDLPERLFAHRDQMEKVHECQTPVFLHTELTPPSLMGKLEFFLDIPRESPTVRGYGAILLDGLNGATPRQLLATPEDVYMLLGLHEAITPQRLRGLHALIVYMKKQVRSLLHQAA